MANTVPMEEKVLPVFRPVVPLQVHLLPMLRTEYAVMFVLELKEHG